MVACYYMPVRGHADPVLGAGADPDSLKYYLEGDGVDEEMKKQVAEIAADYVIPNPV